ncbi:MAG: hypothetical protein MI717_00990 [Spirochaetales bacterium]|nr:hypothetical protein [Spirochaetales bacterium]
MKIALFHYHLKPGGVTDVIIHSCRALLNGHSQLQELRLVSGEETGTQEVMERIREGLDRSKADVLRLDILDEIAYVQEGREPDPVQLQSRLEARYDEETLWWIHNYHLGKNPAFTEAVAAVAASGERDVLLHIHDFPECGRPQNLNRLKGHPPYPTGSRVRYGVINERDRRILADAGLEDSVALLPNPVPPFPLPPNKGRALDELFSAFSQEAPSYIPGAAKLLYPVRAIRRKNLLEAGLFARLLERPANLLVTLPGTSDQESSYSQCVASAFQENLIPGVWLPRIPEKDRPSYPEIASSCDAVLSTSVQEGFGYLFMNALRWQKPLLGRYLDVMDGLLDLFGDYPRRFWADLRVPCSPELRKRTEEAYLGKIEGLKSQLPDRSLKSMTTAVRKLFSHGGMDISFLSVEDQLEALTRCRDDESYREAAQGFNKELLETAQLTLQAHPPHLDRQVDARFGDGAFLRAFGSVVRSLGDKSATPASQKVQSSILKSFARIDYLRLVYDYQ